MEAVLNNLNEKGHLACEQPIAQENRLGLLVAIPLDPRGASVPCTNKCHVQTVRHIRVSILLLHARHAVQHELDATGGRSYWLIVSVTASDVGLNVPQSQ